MSELELIPVVLTNGVIGQMTIAWQDLIPPITFCGKCHELPQNRIFPPNNGGLTGGVIIEASRLLLFYRNMPDFLVLGPIF